MVFSLSTETTSAVLEGKFKSHLLLCVYVAKFPSVIILLCSNSNS